MSKKELKIMEKMIPIVERYERLLDERVDNNVGDIKKVVNYASGPTYVEESIRVSKLLREARAFVKSGGES